MAELRKPYSSKDKNWKDHQGLEIPYGRTSALERLQEKNAFAIVAEALKLQTIMEAFKERFDKLHNEVLNAHEVKEGAKVKGTKGNKVWYSFDRSVRVEADVQDRIEFESITIGQAREKLNAYIAQAVGTDKEFVVELVTSAFNTTNGKLDAKKVMSLTRFRSKIKADLFQEALDLIEKSITRTSGKVYYRVSLLQEDGSYENINLNFSAL